ncbi:hypothetical protein [Candidatus Nitrosotenuis sp. DW1]|uniref:hypothetical protein n=1 Tax=Candidatus Nitrosotenuis sp. DW1 TaxID=2259672 RepID=UPI0015CAB473|nr:hypothetical protein [Candidatus Nitrosotenuis sp. DW1]QLH08488.1 hypothetical protein DSQ19_02420 [Candidatus Nitrosotenuis sp. DW1]
MIFSEITGDLQAQLKSNLPQIRILLKKNPAMAYTKITEIGFAVGRKYKIQLIVNFPQRGKIEDFDSYGMQDLSIIIDRQKKNFPIQRSIIKDKAREIFGNIQIDDAYMYEGKEGVRVFPDGGRIDILPHSIHIWCKFDEKVTSYCNWLLINVYQMSYDSSFTSS